MIICVCVLQGWERKKESERVCVQGKPLCVCVCWGGGQGGSHRAQDEAGGRGLGTWLQG